MYVCIWYHAAPSTIVLAFNVQQGNERPSLSFHVSGRSFNRVLLCSSLWLLSQPPPCIPSRTGPRRHDVRSPVRRVWLPLLLLPQLYGSAGFSGELSTALYTFYSGRACSSRILIYQHVLLVGLVFDLTCTYGYLSHNFASPALCYHVLSSLLAWVRFRHSVMHRRRCRGTVWRSSSSSPATLLPRSLPLRS